VGAVVRRCPSLRHRKKKSAPIVPQLRIASDDDCVLPPELRKEMFIFGSSYCKELSTLRLLQVMGPWGPVKPGLERKPWVGERVPNMSVEAGFAKWNRTDPGEAAI
jgi:hypothetical protein